MADNKKQKEQLEKIKPKRKRKTLNYKKIGIWTAIAVCIFMAVFNAFMDSNPTSTNCTIQQVYEMQDSGLIDKVVITKNGNTFNIYDTLGNVYTCINPNNDTFIKDLADAGINIDIKKTSTYDAVVSALLILPTTLVMLMFIYYLSTTIVGGNTKMFTLLKKENNKVKFDDIAGISEIKAEIIQTMAMIRNYKELAATGARPCKGILLYGPPGVGKTLIAKAIANEVNLPFISASGSDFTEMFVGVGAARVRSLWDLALQNSPCILFIDEIDTLGKRRQGNGGDSEKNQTLNALLQRMDGLNENSGVIVIAATNDKDALDSALIRPGRFDRHIYIGPPRLKKDKEEIIKLYLDTKDKEDEVTVEAVSSLISNMTGAQIEAALNNAVYNSFANNRNGKINLSDVDMGIMALYTDGVPVEIASEHDRKITAVHEAGHCIMSLILNRKVSKVSVIPYSSGIGGMTVNTLDDTEDNKLKLKSEYMNDIKVLLAGKVAEDLIFGEHTQGASNDIERATELICSTFTSFAFDKNIVNYTVFIKNGLIGNMPNSIIENCDRALHEIEEEIRKELANNIDYIKALAKKLMTDKSVMFPTLEKIKEYHVDNVDIDI